MGKYEYLPIFHQDNKGKKQYGVKEILNIFKYRVFVLTSLMF